jgi:GNAT superfamily N-acetyltransferase
MRVRQARTEDRAAVVATVVEAFADDPAWSFLFDDEYEQASALFAGALFDARVMDGTILLTDQAESVALWDSPAASDHYSAGATARDRLREVASDALLARLDSYHAAVDVMRPRQPHWYLGVLATRPSQQRRGLAAEVLAPTLAVADADGLLCCLETSAATNCAYYQRHGFAVAATIAVPGGPPTWWLQRSPHPV